MSGQDADFLAFDEIFASVGVLGHEFSARLRDLDGRQVTMRGHLAPAGHDGGGVLVLTRDPVAPCSDCGGGHDWPEDAVFVFPAGPAAGFPQGPVTLRGVLEHGSMQVEGANSLVRLRDAHWQKE